MLTEREIEEKLKEKIGLTLGNKTARMVGTWDVVDVGELKGQGDASKVVLAFSVGLRQYQSFCTPQADFPCALVLSVRRDACPTGGELADFIEPIMNQLHIWNEDCDRMCDDLTTLTFNVGGFQLDGGTLQQDENAWTITMNFTLRGIVCAVQQ